MPDTQPPPRRQREPEHIRSIARTPPSQSVDSRRVAHDDRQQQQQQQHIRRLSGPRDAPVRTASNSLAPNTIPPPPEMLMHSRAPAGDYYSHPARGHPELKPNLRVDQFSPPDFLRTVMQRDGPPTPAIITEHGLRQGYLPSQPHSQQPGRDSQSVPRPRRATDAQYHSPFPPIPQPSSVDRPMRLGSDPRSDDQIFFEFGNTLQAIQPHWHAVLDKVQEYKRHLNRANTAVRELQEADRAHADEIRRLRADNASLVAEVNDLRKQIRGPDGGRRPLPESQQSRPQPRRQQPQQQPPPNTQLSDARFTIPNTQQEAVHQLYSGGSQQAPMGSLQSSRPPRSRAPSVAMTGRILQDAPTNTNKRPRGPNDPEDLPAPKLAKSSSADTGVAKKQFRLSAYGSGQVKMEEVDEPASVVLSRPPSSPLDQHPALEALPPRRLSGVSGVSTTPTQSPRSDFDMAGFDSDKRVSSSAATSPGNGSPPLELPRPEATKESAPKTRPAGVEKQQPDMDTAPSKPANASAPPIFVLSETSTPKPISAPAPKPSSRPNSAPKPISAAPRLHGPPSKSNGPVSAARNEYKVQLPPPRPQYPPMPPAVHIEPYRRQGPVFGAVKAPKTSPGPVSPPLPAHKKGLSAMTHGPLMFSAESLCKQCTKDGKRTMIPQNEWAQQQKHWETEHEAELASMRKVTPASANEIRLREMTASTPKISTK
ncbi:hypothetical protein CYLTODRAFT_490728 [Cylindrobasidium torrendii FP15055 ss-10]|uniref:Uncharacterized protein n=1 Tax=Cylindrobasidium torrendii FP15055 ss-10 TaxID=1314674 RepID=A0A0D7BAW5_9AGAR|nr:hypothetical protein CYLTODRAFT_490728 [Cylindrobasidium torrendii FP15055 ss-10]